MKLLISKLVYIENDFKKNTEFKYSTEKLYLSSIMITNCNNNQYA